MHCSSIKKYNIIEIYCLRARITVLREITDSTRRREVPVRERQFWRKYIPSHNSPTTEREGLHRGCFPGPCPRGGPAGARVASCRALSSHRPALAPGPGIFARVPCPAMDRALALPSVSFFLCFVRRSLDKSHDKSYARCLPARWLPGASASGGARVRAQAASRAWCQMVPESG
jgi:hypothetical protein